MVTSASSHRVSKPLKKKRKRVEDDFDANIRPNMQSQVTSDHKILKIEPEEEPAPYIILVQGPPNVGKSLLIKSLVNFYTKRRINEIRGPITIIAGKKRRLQLVECPNDVCGMIDAAKYADVVLLLIDASYGFEMETFEFLNLLQVHGVPKFVGVLTHLDGFKDKMEMSETKQRLKLQFWTEIYDGAELFYLSGLDRGMYRKSQVHELAKFLSDTKLHPLSWRAAHPYVLVNHFEDITPPERVHVDKKCDRNITLDGYLRGCNIGEGTKVHIAGVGDFPIAGMTRLADPCPSTSAARMKGLSDNIYAPMPVLEGLVHDKDLEYIETSDESVQLSNVEKNGRSDIMNNVDPANEEQNLRRLVPLMEASGSPYKDIDSKRGSELHEQQANDVLCSYKVEDFDMLQLRKGTYIRLEVHGVPFEMVENFDPYHPILVGGISLEEENAGYMQAWVKQHRWHTKLLKTGDPITVSIGWRRYQTTPVYAMEEETSETGLHEMLHCTPEHKYCLAQFWGPLARPNAGLVAIQNVAEDKAAFQITATGVLLRNYQTKKIVKKHKQKGTVYKFITGYNVLIDDMFASYRDVAEHKNVKIYTAGGIIGRVVEPAPKKLVYKLKTRGDRPGEGIARCSFLRKVFIDDEFFRLVYKPVEVPRCFNPFLASQFTDVLDKDEPAQRCQTLGERRAVVFSEGEPKTSRQLHEEYKIKKKQMAMEKKKSQMLVPEKKRRYLIRMRF